MESHPERAVNASTADSATWRRRLESAQFAFVALTVVTANGSVAISQMALGGALALFLARVWIDPPSRVRLGVETTVALFAGWTLLMIPLSEDPRQSIIAVKRFYLVASMWVVASVAMSEMRRRWLALAFVGGAVLVSIWGVGREFFEHGTLFARRTWFVSNAMTSGAILMLAGIVALAFAIAPGLTRRSRAASGVACAVIVLALGHTMTRGAVLGLLIAAVTVFATMRPRTGIALFVMAGIAFAMIWFAGDAVLPAALAQRLSPEELTQGRNVQSRLEIWTAGLRMIADHPWLGVGDIGVRELSRPYYDPDAIIVQGHMHNNLIHIGVIWGLPGIGLFLAYSVRQVWMFVRRRHEAQAAERPWAAAWGLAGIGAAVAFFVAGLTDWYFGDAEVLLLFSCVAGVALAPSARRDEATET